MLPFDPQQPFVWLEDSLGPGRGGPSWLFTGLVSAEQAGDGDLHAALARLAQPTGDWLAGWMAYEAGYALEPRLARLGSPGAPLMWFGRFRARQRFDPAEVEALWRYPVASAGSAETLETRDDVVSDASYANAIEQILDYIRAGDVYQVNFTLKTRGQTRLHPLMLYRHLRESQRVPYGALIHDGHENWTLSFSPELFFRIESDVITARPMKGTARRHPVYENDLAAAVALQNDEKNRAENLMIVDLLRNDISRVAETGTVQVPALYEIETYATLHQMTSTVQATRRADKSAIDVLAALFPCGSVTGAPKIRAMEIIHELETQPRGIYCGAIGWIGPDGDAAFNVPIRTIAVCEREISFGVGSGIVADSIAADEWAECQLKGQFLYRKIPPFDLFETLLWRPEYGYWELAAHLARLQHSAAYWGFQSDIDGWRLALDDFAGRFKTAMRVRFLLSRSGAVSLQAVALPVPQNQTLKLSVSPNRMHSSNPFLFHKTTNRAFYDDERMRLMSLTGCDEVLFLNERGEVTEGSFTTLFIRKNGKLLTPSLSCGLLPGVLRQNMISHQGCEERILTLDDVRSAEAILVGNSVRGLQGAQVDFG